MSDAHRANQQHARLLLDEMFALHIATELTARGHDCIAVAADERLRQSTDAELFAIALSEQRAVVTNNVIDFERLRRHYALVGQPVPALIYTSDGAFPRNRRFVGRLVTALDHACATDAVTTTGGVYWLHPAGS